MGELDQYARSLESELDPGEELHWVGLVQKYSRYNFVGNPAGKLTHYWMLATDRRLLFYEAKLPKALGSKEVGHKPLEWEWTYREIDEVGVKWFGGLHKANAVTLRPHEGYGPLDGRAMRVDIKQEWDGSDVQKALCHEFPQWLQQQVAAAEAPPPKPKPAEQKPAKKSSSGPSLPKLSIKVVIPAILTFLLFGGTIGAAVGTFSYYDEIERFERSIIRYERKQRRAAERGDMTSVKHYKEMIDKKTKTIGGDWNLVYVLGAVTLILAFLTLVGGVFAVVMFVKSRKKNEPSD